MNKLEPVRGGMLAAPWKILGLCAAYVVSWAGLIGLVYWVKGCAEAKLAFQIVLGLHATAGVFLSAIGIIVTLAGGMKSKTTVVGGGGTVGPTRDDGQGGR